MDRESAQARPASGGKASCWDARGCDSEMMGRCPHVRETGYFPCPADCRYSECALPWHVVATDVALLLDATVDRRAAVRQTCLFCEHFLLHAPRLDGLPGAGG